MSAGVFTTPRPIPGRLVPALAGSALIALALPVFVVTGWPLGGWVLGVRLAPRLHPERFRNLVLGLLALSAGVAALSVLA